MSGEGAAGNGGRFNPPGTPALYLALTVEGMICEMGHGFAHRFEPLTICSYLVDVDDVLDLRAESGRRDADVDLADMACAWFADRSDGRFPASWTVAARLIARGCSGILVPSFASGARPDMSNLVLWRWGPGLPHKVEVHDPSGRLPRNALSWPNPAAC